MEQIPRIGMDTMTDREGLHLWVTGTAETMGLSGDTLCNASISVHLSRSQAKALINEINRRLF